MTHYMTYHIEHLNLDGRGDRPTRVYDTPSLSADDFWASVTDVHCPGCSDGIARWAEAGYVPGYRICDGCGRHFIARGDVRGCSLALVRR